MHFARIPGTWLSLCIRVRVGSAGSGYELRVEVGQDNPSVLVEDRGGELVRVGKRTS